MRIKFHRLGLWLVIIVFSLAVVLFPGCAPKAAPPATPTLEPFKISVNTSLTGAGASSCVGHDIVVDFVVKMVNRAGGLKGGHPLQGSTYDNQTKIDLAVAGAKKAIFEDKVKMLTVVIAGFCKAVEPITNENRIIFFPASGGFQPTSRYTFKPLSTDEVGLQVTVGWLKKQVGSLKLGYLASTDSTGEIGVAAITKLAPKNNVPLVVERFNMTDVDVKTQLTKLKGSGINALLIHCTGAQASMAAKTALELGYTMPVIISWGNENQAFADLLKDLTVDNLYIFGHASTDFEPLPANHPVGATARWLTTTYKKEMGLQWPGAVGGLVFDGIMVIISAMDAVGTDPEAMVNYLENNVKLWMGFSDFYTFSPDNHAGGSGEALVIHRIKGGKFILMPDSIQPIPPGYKTIPMLERIMKIK